MLKSKDNIGMLVANGLNDIVGGRGKIAHTVRTLNAIETDGSLREASYNCPGQTSPLSAAQQSDESNACPVAAIG